MTMLDVGSAFFIGGVPYLSSINMAAVKDVQSQSDFIGCMSYLQVSDHYVEL